LATSRCKEHSCSESDPLLTCEGDLPKSKRGVARGLSPKVSEAQR
jgi:hypothetical protein